MLPSTKVANGLYSNGANQPCSPKTSQSFIFIIVVILIMRVVSTLDGVTLSALLTFLHYIALIVIIVMHVPQLPSLKLELCYYDAPSISLFSDSSQSNVLYKVVTMLFDTLPSFVYDSTRAKLKTANVFTAISPTVMNSTTQTESVAQSSSSDQVSQTDIECIQPSTSETFQHKVDELQDTVQKHGEELLATKQEIDSYNQILRQLLGLIGHQQQELQSIISQTSDSKTFCDNEKQNTCQKQSHLNKEDQQDSEQSKFVSSNRLKTTLTPSELQSLSSIVDTFDGNSYKYQSFKSRFSTIVDTMDLTDADKALVLYVSLDKEVLAFLGDITDTGSVMYEKLWTALDEEFDPPLHGMYTHISELFSIHSMPQCDSLEKLVSLYKFIKKHYIALKKIGAGQEVEGFKIQVLSKLCGTVSDKVASLIIEKGEKPVVPCILDILKEEISCMELQNIARRLKGSDLRGEKEINGRESFSGIEKDVNVYPEPPVKSILKHSSMLQHKEVSCIFCRKQDHPSNECRKYTDPSDFQKVLFQQYCCYNCLSHGHKSYACPKHKQCSLCSDSRKHSIVLCTLYNH